MHTTRTVWIVVCAAFVAGCGQDSKQPAFPELHEVKGVVKRGGEPVKGGAIQLTPEPNKPEFLINAEVGADGAFTITTVRTTDTKGERKTGAPAGKYQVTYTPPLGDQTAGGNLAPINLPTPVTVNTGTNNLPIELPRK